MAGGRPLPLLTDRNRFYWTSGADGRLRIQWCPDCDSLQHPPQPVCRHCRSGRLVIREVSGRGAVQGHTTNHQQWSPSFAVPYSVAVVALEEDARVRITTNIVGCGPDEVTVGLPVRVRFEPADDVWIPVFEPTGEPPVGLPDDAADIERFRSVRPMLRAEKFEDRSALTGIGM